MRRPFLIRALSAALVGPMIWMPIQAYAQESLPERDTIADEAIAIPEETPDQPPELALDEEQIEEIAEQTRDLFEEGAETEYTAPSPTGAGDKSAATPQAIALPKAEGSIQGMGESFSPILSSGTATFTVPIALPPGRNGFTPPLALSYSSTGGNGHAGFGWSFGVGFIARQIDRGVPRYVDGPAWHAEEDRFLYNGGQELVPVSTSGAEIVDCGTAGCAPIPTELIGWQQYRARIEGGYHRFFRSPDGRRWVVQSKDGTRYDFGVLSVGDGPAEMQTLSTSALQSESPGGTGRVYRWLLTRVTDPHGSVAYYTYFEDQGDRYLEDIYYLSPHSSCGALPSVADRMRCSAALSLYGRRVRFVYEDRDDVVHSYVAGWGVHTGFRLRRIEITGASGTPGGRSLVRRVHLSYDPASYYSLLASVQLEGRPAVVDTATGAVVGDPNIPEGSLDDTIVGATLPPLVLSYTTQPDSADFAPGFGGIDATIRTSAASPPHSVDEDRADLFDVNSDGLPDLIVTNPALYDDGVGVFFNGFDGPDATPAAQAGTFSDAVVLPVPWGFATTLTLSNANVVPMDIDGDGRSDLLHMPRVANYGYFTPGRAVAPSPTESVSPADQGWRWSYVARALPAGELDPRIDFTGDTPFIKVFDVNNDHLIDVVRTTGTSIQTWLNLGWLPGGDGRFGSYQWDGGAWILSTEPIETCLPHAGVPLDFADPEVKLADLNGDGVQDIVRVRPGSVIYWPGRGEGLWGEGSPECPAGFASGRQIVMVNAPPEINPELDGVYFADVNADGADDMIQVRFDDIDVWFNRGGDSFTDRVIASGTPHAPAFSSRVRVTDIDGSGTIDVVYGQAGNWQWVDLMGGRKPRLLTVVRNSLGGRSEVSYASSTEDYLADLADATSCTSSTCERFTWTATAAACDQKVLAGSGECVYRSSGTPVISTVVRGIDTTDRFGDGPSENVLSQRYAYHDGYYEGIEQEFRGFGGATEEAIGDANHPTAYTRTRFHQGRRGSAIASDRLADNPDEALKAEPYVVEVFDTFGRYVSATHRTLRTRALHVGLNGLAVQDAYEAQADQLGYDTAPFESLGTILSLPGVIRSSGTENHDVRIRGVRYSHVRSTTDEIDNVGNVRRATKHGRIRGEVGESLPNETIVSRATITNLTTSATGWLWKATLTSVDGHGDATPLGATTREFNGSGDELSATIDVNQSMLYDFSPTLGSPVPEDIGATRTFDAWGNLLVACAGGTAATGVNCLRRSALTYDTNYAAFPITESTATRRNGGGFDSLTTLAEWDTALGAMLAVTDPNGDRSAITFDGFGRFTSVTPPPVTGCASGVVGARVEYAVTTDPDLQPISRMTTTTRLSCTDPNQTVKTVVYVDGLGRSRATLSTGDGTAGREWIKSGVVTFDTRGAVRLEYLPAFHTPAPEDVGAAVALPASAFTETRYEAFDRPVVLVATDGAMTTTSYHALSRDLSDPLDLDLTSPHYGTFSTERVDGHGRVVDQVLRNRQPGGSVIEFYRLWTDYRADGAAVRVERAETTSDAHRPLASIIGARTVVRTFVYDTAGRRVATTDPDTNNPSGATWRYLFNRVSDLVAVRDPRGCGQDFLYDHAARLLGEAYIGCSETQPHEQPTEQVPTGAVAWTETTAARTVQVRHVYDTYAGTWAPSPAGFTDYPTAPAGLLGRVATTSDRGQRSVFAYDRRGNVIWEGRQMALIPGAGTVPATLSDPLPATPAAATPPASDSTVAYDEAHTYVVTHTFDHAGRPRAIVLPRDPDFTPGPGPRLSGRIAFGTRGLPVSATVDIVSGGSTPVITDGVIGWGGATVTSQAVVTALVYESDGLLSSTTYGDTLGGTRAATVSTIEYDVRRRPIRSRTVRAPTGVAVPPDRPLYAVTVPFDQELVWDRADNLSDLYDRRIATEWPAGHRPQNVRLTHDSLYRVVDADFTYSQDSGPATTNDAATDWRVEQARTRPNDPMRTEPAPYLPNLPAGRVVNLLWEFDWLGNMRYLTDDAHAFYERSIGTITNGAYLFGGPAPARPSALYLAADLAGPPADRGGYVELDYGVGGNVIGMTAHARCVDAPSQTCSDPGGTDIAARRAALDTRCTCASEQHYQYLWDELNRLSEARRYDRTAGVGLWVLAVRQRYRYDGANQRAVKQTLDAVPAIGDPGERVALFVSPGDFERRGVTTGLTTYQANTTLGTETQYLLAGSRVVWEPGSPLTGLDPAHRITVNLTDLLGTTAAVLDIPSGELIETSTYYPNGARETYRTTAAANVAAEPMGFTTKEADDEVGMVYFGERYLIPRIARWASPDPLAIHALGGGEAMNSYHYVAGNILSTRDPIGLELENGVLDLTRSFNANRGARIARKIIDEKREQDPLGELRKELGDQVVDEVTAFSLRAGLKYKRDYFKVSGARYEHHAWVSLINGATGTWSIKYSFESEEVVDIVFTGVGHETSPLDALAPGATGILARSLTRILGRPLGRFAIFLKIARIGRAGFGALSRAADYGILPYHVLRKHLKGTGLHAHHLIEKRFAATMGQKADDMVSVAVTRTEHEAFTRAWRQRIPYKHGTRAATKKQVEAAAKDIYKDHPAILEALGLE